MCHSLGVDHVRLRTRSFPACRATTSVKSLRMSVQSYDELCDLETGEGCSVSDVRSARKQGLYKEMPKSSPPKIPEPPPPRALPKIVSTDDNTAQSCFGTHYYWDEMYLGRGDFPADEYSWYFGWDVVKSFWTEAVPDKGAKILCPGVGNDPSLFELVTAGWRHVTAFDYSENAIDRQREILDENPSATSDVTLHCLDARELPEDWTGSFDAMFEKGALDAVFLSGDGNVERAATEIARVVRSGGVVVSFSGVVPEDLRRDIFPTSTWDWLRDGSTDLRAGCFVWRKR